MSQETQPTEEKKEMTPEQIKDWRDKMTKYYKEQLPLLKAQKEYETVLADIEEARARRMTMTIRLAQMMAPPEDEDEPAPPPEEQKVTPPADAPPQERKLKSE
jgi:outer membrane protein TolC